jgi:hypothetical protein
MSELFSDDEVNSLSPADEWAKRNSITVYHDGEMAVPWVAWMGSIKATANTKEGALLAMANRLKIEFYR